jgi:uncharacterized protein (TIGR03437 family)
MKRITLLLSGFVFAAALHAQTVESIPYRAVLLATNEPTPVVDATAKGIATIWLHLIRDAAGKVASGTIDFNANFQFAIAETVTLAHIHKGPAGVAGGVVIPVPFTRFDQATGAGSLPVRQVAFSTADANSLVIDSVNGILADPSAFYFNIHTVDSPSGALRGQLQRADMVVLMAQMNSANEVPAIASSTSVGTATVVALRTRDASGNLTSGQVTFDVNYSGFPTDTSFSAMHLHFGTPVVAGPVTIDSGLRGPLAAGAAGSGNLHFEAEVDLTRNLAPQTLNALFTADPGSTVYINAHTAVFPGGAIRAQLRRTERTVFQVTALPSNEVPPTSINASAPSAVNVYTIRNSDGSVPAGAVIFDVNPIFPPGQTFALMHIHDQVAGQNGNVTIDSRLTATPLLTSDSGGNIWRLTTVSNAAGLATLNSLLQNPERHYLNLHTGQFPGGAVRSQLRPANTAVPAISSIISSVNDGSRTTAANGALMNVFGKDLVKVGANLDGFGTLEVLPQTVNGTSMTVGGIKAPFALLDPGQLIFQVPVDVPAGVQPVVVTNSNGPSAVFNLTVAPVSPNIFFDTVGGLVFRPDFSLILPSNPAAANDVLILFATGLGQTSSPLNTGRIVPGGPPFFTTQPVTITVGGKQVTALYSVAVPGFAGLTQVAFQLPAGIAPGTAALSLSVGGVTSNTVNIAVK